MKKPGQVPIKGHANLVHPDNLVIFGTAPNQVFGFGSVTRITSPSLNLPVDLAAIRKA
jgi:hypothetical protein